MLKKGFFCGWVSYFKEVKTVHMRSIKGSVSCTACPLRKAHKNWSCPAEGREG